MQKNWKKTILFAAPLLVIGSVYGFTAEGQSSHTSLAGASANASTTTGSSGSVVTSKVVASQTLTPQELQQLQNAQPAPTQTASGSTTNTTGTTDTSGTDQSLIDANNPFTVQGSNGSTTDTSGSTDTNGSTGSTTDNSGGSAPVTGGSAPVTGGTDSGSAGTNNFSLDLVKNLQITMNTTQGALTLHFTSDDNGGVKLDGDLGGRHLSLQGDQAQQILNNLLQTMNLNSALTASLSGQQVNLDPSVLGALQQLHVELKDGRHIDSNGPGNGNGPKANGPHDNGKHVGQEKHGKGPGKHGDN